MHRDVTLVAKKNSNKLKYLKLKKENEKLQKKLLYCFKRSFQLGDKQFCVIYTLTKKITITTFLPNILKHSSHAV